MSWFKDGLKDVWDAFLGRDIGNTSSGFGGSGSSRSDTLDQLNLPNSATSDDPEEIRQLTTSLTDTRDTNASIPVIYGVPIEFLTRPAGGREAGLTLAHISTSGTNNEILHLTWWISHGPIQGLDAVDLNYGDNNIANLAPETGTLWSWRFQDSPYYSQTIYDGYGKIFVHNGDYSNPAAPTYHADENYYPGIAHVKIRLQLPTSGVVDPPFTNLPALKWFVYGINPTQLTNDTETTTNRRALYLYDYLINPVYGANIAKSDLDIGSFMDSYGIRSNNLINVIQDTGQVLSDPTDFNHESMYITADKSIGQNVTQQLAEMQSVLAFKRGKFYLKPNDNLLAVSTNWRGGGYLYPSITRFTLTEEKCLGGIVFTPPSGDSKPNKYSWKYIAHREVVGTVDNVTYYSPREREATAVSPYGYDSRATGVAEPSFSYLTEPTSAELFGIAYSTPLKSSLSFKASGDFLNADPYDIVRVDHPSYRGLFWYDFVIVDVRINSDLTVDIQATGSLRFNASAGSLTSDSFESIEQDSDNFLKKYIYDYPEGDDGVFQFHNQELSEYNENRFSDTYEPGVIIDPETGIGFNEGEVLLVTPRNPQSAIHPYYDHTITDTVISQRFMVEVAPTVSGQFNLYIRAYTKDPITEVLTPVQRGNFNDPFVSVPSNDRMPEQTTYQGTSLPQDSEGQFFEFTLTLLENTEYVIRVESYNNTTGELVNTIDLDTFTTYSDASNLDVNLFSYRAGTLESAFGSISYGGGYGNLSGVLAACLGGTLTVKGDLMYGQGGGVPRTWGTINIPSTSVADALEKTFFWEFNNSDWTDISPQPYYDIEEDLEFRDSGGNLIHTQTAGYWIFWGNTKLERAANFSKGNLYNLSEEIQTALVDAGRTDLLW